MKLTIRIKNTLDSKKTIGEYYRKTTNTYFNKLIRHLKVDPQSRVADLIFDYIYNDSKVKLSDIEAELETYHNRKRKYAGK